MDTLYITSNLNILSYCQQQCRYMHEGGGRANKQTLYGRLGVVIQKAATSRYTTFHSNRVLAVNHHTAVFQNSQMIKFPDLLSGNEVIPGTHPWQVSIRYRANDVSFCGGSILSKNWIVTAAHCFKMYEVCVKNVYRS